MTTGIDRTAIKWIVKFLKTRDTKVPTKELMTEIDHTTLHWPLFAIKALIDDKHFWHIIVIDDTKTVNSFLRAYQTQELKNPMPECKVKIKAFKKEETQFFVYYDWGYKPPIIRMKPMRLDML